ncbi:MAG TPA: helix-turn-helix transcriptional regulator [Frankiaceae bacterium]|nr:helix-turn-helix transcriptional regulator [Frankiaceae bacterium]
MADSAWLYAAAPQQARPVGEVLRTWRQAHGLTQRQLGRMVGFDQTYVSKVEAGQRVIRDVDTLRLLARTLGIAPEELGLACDAGDDPDGPRGTATRTPLTWPTGSGHGEGHAAS